MMAMGGSTMNKRQKLDRETLEEFTADLEPGLQKVVGALIGAVKEIAVKIRTASCAKAHAFNDFGDAQLEIDVMSDELIFKNLKSCGSCEVASSEESPREISQGGKGYSVAFDPLDGSSIIDTNFAVGTICGIWPGGTLVGVSGNQMVASIVAQYGPRTTLSVAFADKPHAHEFQLSDVGVFERTNTFKEISEGKLFAPGNLCSTQDNPGYMKLMNYWMVNKYSLRYSGGMVPDVNQLLIKGKGIFVAPSSPLAPAKLRLLYEVMPMAFLVEKAGGRSSNGRISIMDMVSLTTEDRTQVAIGSAEEVKRFDELVGFQEAYVTVSKDDPTWKHT